jgi:hypothetical protein
LQSAKLIYRKVREDKRIFGEIEISEGLFLLYLITAIPAAGLFGISSSLFGHRIKEELSRYHPGINVF